MGFHWGDAAEVIIGGLAVAGATAFVGMVVWYIKMKPTVENIKKDIGDLRDWKAGHDAKGGVVNRNDHFEFCKGMQAKCAEGIGCRLGNLEEWRDDMLEKGGPVVRNEHLAMCERVTEKLGVEFRRVVADGLGHIRELVTAELTATKALIQKDVIEEIRKIGQEVKQHNGSK